MERIFYSAGIQDEILGHPVYIFDTTYLPHHEEIDYNDLVSVLTDSLPRTPYVVVMFSGGLNRIGWIWGVKFVRSFLVDELHVRNLSRLYTVHELWFLKSITQFFSNINSTKASLGALNRLVDVFSSPKSTKLTRCSSIAELSNYMPVSKLKISLNVYKYDAELGSSEWAMRIVPLVNPLTEFDPTKSARFYNHFYNLFSIISIYGPCAKAIFLKPGNKLCTDILYDCINRNQLMWINDWDLYCISGVFKRILQNMPFPLINHENISLPMQDTLGYTQATFDTLIVLHNSEGHTGYAQVLLQLCDMCHRISDRVEVTLHTPTTMAKCLAHCVSQQPLSSQVKGPVQMVTRLLTNLISQWKMIASDYDFPSIEDCLEGKMAAPHEFSPQVTAHSSKRAPEVPHKDVTGQNRDVEERLGGQLRYEDASRYEDDWRLGGELRDETASRYEDDWRLGNFAGEGNLSEPIKFGNGSIPPHGHPATTPAGIPTINASTHMKDTPGNSKTSYSENAQTIPTMGRSLSFPNANSENGQQPTPRPPTLSDATRGLLSHSSMDTLDDLFSSHESEIKDLPTPKSNEKPPEPHVAVQWPPQKYKFLIERKNPPKQPEAAAVEKLKPVTVRGLKVGELTRLFEERALGLEIIRGMQQLRPQ